jgi:hypothetical protein
VVFIVLGANVFLTKVVAGGLYSRIVYAEKSPDKWQKEFDEYAKTGGQWPYNDSIDCPSHILRFLNVWGVLLAAVLLILSVLNPVESGAKKADQTATNSHIANAVQQPAIPTNAPSGQ